jgi:hypothetical protein
MPALLDTLLIATVFVTFHSFAGFINRKNLSESAPEVFNGFPDTNFYLSKWKFACNSLGHSWYNPQGIATKINNMFRCGGMYGSHGDIYINLPAIQRYYNKGKFFRGYEPETSSEGVEYILEHEALHSAIRSHAEIEFEKQEHEFKEKWNSSSRLGKIKIFYSSLIYGFGGGVPWNEEWIIKQIQDAKRSNREIQRLRKQILPDRGIQGGVSG